MPPEDTKTAEETAVEELRAAELQEQADFDSGAAVETPAKPAAAAAAATDDKAAAATAGAPAPKYVRMTKEQFDRLDASANKTAALEAQLSKAFGTLGNLQKVVNATPRGLKVEIPKDAFAAMERDFPELAQHSRDALEATLRGLGLTGTASAEHDPEQLQKQVSEHFAKARIAAEIEALEDTYPDWRKIVGQVDVSKEQPDKNNPFRKWLTTKDPAYQAKLNNTNSAAVLSRAIRAFQAETKAPPKTTPAISDRTARIQGAIRPRGDGGQASTGRTDDDEFAAGYAAG